MLNANQNNKQKFLFLLQQRMIYIDKIVNLIIRPTRDQYHVRRLGDPEIIMKTSKGQSIKCIREDRVILNKHNEHIHLSYYAIQQIEHRYTTLGGYSYYFQPKPQNINLNIKNIQQPSPFASHSKVTDFKSKCVIYLHANNGSRIQGMTYLQKLIQAQCNVCLFDCSGSGLSEGEYITLGLKQARDLDCVVNFLVRQKKLTQVILWGRSMGAATAIIYGSKHSKVKISGMVLDSPFKNLQKLIVDLASDRTGLPKILFQPLIPLIRSEILNKTGYNIDELNLKRYIERDTEGNQTSRSRQQFNESSDKKDISGNKCDPQDKLSTIPALFIVSKNDKFVHYSHTEKLFKRYRCEDKEIMYIETEHHEMRGQRDIERIIKFIVDHLNINQTADQYEVNNLSSLKFTKNVLTRSRLDTNRVTIKDQPSQDLNPQNKTSLLPTYVMNAQNTLNGQVKTEKYSFYTKKLTSKTVHSSNPIDPSHQQYLTYMPKKLSHHVQSSFSKDHRILKQSIPYQESSNIQTFNENLSQNENNLDLNSAQIIRSLEQFKTLRHNSSHQSLLSKEKRNELSKLTCYSGYSNQNNNRINKVGIKSYQFKTSTNNLSKTNFTQISKGKISLSSMLAHQQNAANYPNSCLHENSQGQAIRYQTLKEKKIDQQPYLSLSKTEQAPKAYPYHFTEKPFFSNTYKKPQNCQTKENQKTLKASIISLIEPSNFSLQNHYEPRKVSTYNRLAD